MRDWLRTWRFVIGVAIGGLVLVLVLSYAGATSFGTVGYDRNAMASWVQATGSIGAIVGAIWIASEQDRRDIARRKVEEERDRYLLAAELAWLSHEVVVFLNQFVSTEADRRHAYIVNDDEVADLLDRLAWCRQRAEHKGQLAMLGTLRKALIATANLIRLRAQNKPMIFSELEVDDLGEWRREARGVMNATHGIEVPPQYRP